MYTCRWKTLVASWLPLSLEKVLRLTPSIPLSLTHTHTHTPTRRSFRLDHSQLKLLRVVVKNLADPVKAQDAKYRQLKLGNEKVREKILPFPCAVDYLTSIGFVETTEDGERILRIEKADGPNMTAAVQEVSNAMDLLTPESNKKPRVAAPTPLSNGGTVAPKLFVPPSKLSEKQKARVLLEEKQRKEKEEAKRQRAKNVAMLKQDKFVRENDANWKSGVSAACAKTGDSISTFRDRHGES